MSPFPFQPAPRGRPGALAAGAGLLLACLLGLAPPAAAEDPGEPLAAVVVRDNRRVETDAIRVVLQTQPGEPLDRARLAADIKAVYALGFFADVRAELEPGDGGPRLVLRVTEKPSIASVDYRGQDSLDIDKIKEVVDIQPLSVLDVSKIRANEQKIRDLYVEKGFFLAEVGHELKPAPENSVALTFVIHERAKILVKRITLLGNEKVPAGDIKGTSLFDPGVIETHEGDFWSWLTSFGTYKEEALKRDVLRIQQYYYNNGFLNAKVGEPIVEISRDRQFVFITFPIEEGEIYSLGNLGFTGDLLVRDEALLKEISRSIAQDGQDLVLSEELERVLRSRLSAPEAQALKLGVLQELRIEVETRLDQEILEEDAPPRESGEELREAIRAEALALFKGRILMSQLRVKSGEIFNQSELGMSLFKVQDGYKDRGYAYVEVIPETHVDAESRIIDIRFNVQKGQKVFIERIEVRGNTRTRDKVIRRMMRVYEGDLYSGSGLERSRRLVNSLGFFEKVDITEKRGSAPDRINLTVEVKERQTGTFQIGAGFSSVENFIATAQVSQQNLFGRGQTLMLTAQLSSLRQFFSLQFFEPSLLDTNWSLNARVYNMQLDYINFLRKATGGALGVGYRFFDFWRFNLNYKIEDVSVSSSSELRHYNLFRDGLTSSLEAMVSWDTRDNQLFPTDGWLLQGSIEWATPYIGSENDFLRLEGVARYYYPIMWGIVIKANLSLGYVTSFAAEVPIFEKYFVGGIYTVRGFEPRSIGPRSRVQNDGYEPDAPLTEFNVGGNKQFLANLELEFPIIPQVNIRGVVFLDAGNAFGEGESLFATRTRELEDGRRLKETFGGLYWSAGFGFRWFSPIGPLRFEWGIPLTRRPEDKDILFEFTIGNFF
jgi:outer membrane protein assembly factor BamA